ncbi:MAG: IPT/TIG domain-containing protein [Armatimonadetes bacterium]|nr:IPT/TIG domain-containing protein [Armatimonadota bacterium]
MSMKRDPLGAVAGVLLCISIFLSGCGGGGGGRSPGGPSGSGSGADRSNISITIRWPGETPLGKLIPSKVSRIRVEITGEGLSSPLADTRDRIPGTPTSFSFADVPLGNKTVSVFALDSGGSTLAFRKIDIVVGTGDTTSDVTLGVGVSDTGFTPRDFYINPGDTVMWSNGGSQIHTVTADNGSFNSGDIALGGTYTFQFATLGDTSYHCTRHPSETGKVSVQSGQPRLDSLSPASAYVGFQVTLTGANFGATQGQSTVTFGGTTASVTSWSDREIKCTVPKVAAAGNTAVTVTVSGISSNGMSFTVSLWKDYIKSGQPFRIIFDAAPNDDGWLGANDPLGSIMGGKTYVCRYEQSTGKWFTTGYSEWNGDNKYTTSQPTVWGNPDQYQLNVWDYRQLTFNEAGEVIDSVYGVVGHLATHDWRAWILSGQPFILSFDRNTTDDTVWLGGYPVDFLGIFYVTTDTLSLSYKDTYNAGAGTWKTVGYNESTGQPDYQTQSSDTQVNSPWIGIADPNLFQIMSWGLGFTFNAQGELLWQQNVIGHLGI